MVAEVEVEAGAATKPLRTTGRGPDIAHVWVERQGTRRGRHGNGVSFGQSRVLGSWSQRGFAGSLCFEKRLIGSSDQLDRWLVRGSSGSHRGIDAAGVQQVE